MVEYWELKKLMLERYGNKCIECGETDIKRLCIVFESPQMRYWRKKFGMENTKVFYQALYKRDFPDKYEILGKYKLITLCKKHYNEFVSKILKGVPIGGVK